MNKSLLRLNVLSLRHFVFLLLYCAIIPASGQCENSDFESGTMVNWMGFTGNCCGISTPNPGIVNGRHTITSSLNGFDPFVAPCFNLPTVPPGGQYACQLGNSGTGAEAERIQYTFSVTPESDLIIYKYAVVLEDPGHDPPDQPRFEAQVLTEAGTPIPCTFYQVAASANIPGFQNCGTGLVFKDWTTVGVDVSDYMGQTVTLDLATGDCSQGGHFGYAYVDAICTSLTLDSRYCVNANSATISAPEGFTYLWSTGATTREIVIPNPVQGQIFSCQLTSVTGCEALLSTAMEFSDVDAQFEITNSCSNNMQAVNTSSYTNGEPQDLAWFVGGQSVDFAETLILGNLQPGPTQIKLVATSDLGCRDSLEMEVLIHANPEIDIIADQECLTDSINISASVLYTENPIDSFQFIDGDGNTTINNSGHFDFVGSGNVLYEFTMIASDLLGCSDTLSEDFLSRERLDLAVNSLNDYNGFDISCNGLNNGEIQAIVSGGNPPYNLLWNHPSGNMNFIVSALPAGTYDCNVLDSDGCEISGGITLVEPQPLLGNITQSSNFNGFNVSCHGINDGWVEFSYIGGVAPVEASINSISIQPDLRIQNLGANYYNIQLIDQNDCQEFIPFEINEPAPLYPYLEVTSNYSGYAISCFGAADGQINTTISGGVPPYNTSWNQPGLSGEDLVGISQGEYIISVTDQNGCADEDTVNLIQPDELIAQDSVYLSHNGFAISCYQFNDGQAEIFAIGGTGNHTIQWPSGYQGPIASGLSAGIHQVSVTDDNNCGPILLDVFVNEPEPLTLDLSISSDYNGSPISCFGSNDGSAIAIANGGALPYNYLWSDGENIALSNNSFGNGFAYCFLEDANNCSLIDSIYLQEPEALELNIQPITNYNGYDISCYNSTDAVLQAIPSGGIGTFSYLWSDGATDEIASDFGRGVYSVTVSDENLCSISSTYTIMHPDTLEVYLYSISSYNGAFVSCAGENNGALEAIAFGGAGMIAYTWSAGTSSTAMSGYVLPAGLNYVVATDVNGCLASDSILSIDPTPLDVTISPNSNYNGYNISCNGGNDGIIEAHPSGGVGQYGVEWIGFQSSNYELYNLEADIYEVLITDQNGCGPIQESIELTEPQPIDYEYSIVSDYSGQDISCYGASDGQAIVQASGGVAPYDYLWQNGFSGPLSSLTLDEAQHICYIEDANGCSALAFIDVLAPEPLLVSVQIESDYSGFAISCPNSYDGIASVLATGGTPSYNYIWSNGEIGPLANSLDSGLTSVIVTDINGCQSDAQIFILPPDSIQMQLQPLNIYNGSPISCAGADDGSVLATSIGGSGDYEYSWVGPNIQGFTNPAEGLETGVVTFIVTDANGCNNVASVALIEPEPLFAEINILSDYNGYDVSCYGSNNAFLDLNVTGGTGEITALWSNGVQGLVNSAIPVGTYNALVYDANGCLFNTSMVELTQPSELIVTNVATSDYNGYNVSCNGGNDGWAQITLGGGLDPYSVVWNDGSSGLYADSLSSGVYMAVASDINNCRVNEVIIINQPTPIYTNIAIEPDYCELGKGRAAVNLSGGVPHYDIVWSNADTTTISCCYEGNSPTALQIIDFNECRIDTSFNFPNIDAPNISAGFSDDSPVCEDISEVQLTLTSDYYPVQWKLTGENFRYADEDNSVIIYTEGGTIPIDVFGYIAPGCFAQTTLIRDVQPEMKVFVPNSFTPGNDGVNDAFKIYGTNIEYIEWSIIDRWGNTYFHGNSLDGYWNGTKLNGNNELLPGIYEWQVKAISYCGEVYESSGHVSLLR